MVGSPCTPRPGSAKGAAGKEGGREPGRGERERGRSRASLSSRAWSLCCRSLGIRPLPAQSCTVRSVHPAQDSRRLLLRAHLGNMLIFIHENSSASLKRSKLAQEPCSLCPETGICPLSHEDRLGSWHCASAAVFGADARTAGVRASLAVDFAWFRVKAGVQAAPVSVFDGIYDVETFVQLKIRGPVSGMPQPRRK